MSERLGCIKPAFFVLLGLLWVGAGGAAPGAEGSSTQAASATLTQSINLEYRDLGYSVGTWMIPITLQSAPFKKEPDLGRRKVYRGTLKFGDSMEDFAPFVWDQAQGKLYLDLNRNQDLTDDGVLACTGQINTSVETFGRVRMPFKTPLGMEQVAVDLFFTDFRATLTAYAMAYYCWEAKVTQGGQEWQLALVDNLAGKIGSAESGSLIIRSWADRGKPIDAQGGLLDCLPFTPNVFFGQRACRLDCALAQQDNKIKYRLTLTERAEQLGELRLTGQYIHRLILSRAGLAGAPGSGNAAQGALARRYGAAGLRTATPAQTSLTVILDSPGPVVKIPVGSYQYQLSLKQGGVEARPLLGNYAGNSRPLVVGATNTATLAAGGPLTNSVAVTQHGRSLALNYQLLGAQGEAYQLQGPRKEPRFTIYRPGKSGDKKLASGAFQFG